MVIVYHISDKVTRFGTTERFSEFVGLPLVKCFLELIKQIPDELIVWCNEAYSQNLNTAVIKELFHHKQLLLSYNVSENFFLGGNIGYIEDSIFINVNKSVRYPTWQMSSDVGVIHSDIVNAFKDEINPNDSFDYFLVSFAKRIMQKGLFCYSEPALFTGDLPKIQIQKRAGNSVVFRFVKQHYQLNWTLILLLNLLLYKKKFPIASFFGSLFYFRRKLDTKFNFNVANVSALSVAPTVDVIVPTIGRKIYLYDFLKDLAKQTVLPQNVIIIEQNHNLEAVTELDYLTTEQWPFQIKHTFTHQPGACRSRNLALEQTSSEWVFFADDDIRIPQNCIEEILKKMNAFHAEAATVNCQQSNDEKKHTNVFQSSFFGSGCSMVKRAVIGNSRFSMAYEFGFGEDNDFGMQLRNKGYDIIYLPNPTILHLKAPVGGFRIKIVSPWSKDLIEPKPSPTVMFYYLKYYTKQQLAGYKTILYFKYYGLQSTKNPVKYHLSFAKRWNKSIFWANHLKNTA